jgi:probable F420-dependent oxidoreductase
MDFGVVLQTDPPAARVIELARQAELYRFSHVWTFDSHLLWQEPFVIYSQILSATRNVTVGPMVTNPATRDWTVTASLFATLNDMFGNRTICGIGRGDSAVRVINGKPVSLATLREAIAVIRPLANGEQADYKGTEVRFPWGARSRLPVWVAAYGPKALALAGEVGDGFILQLADPDITAWSVAAVRAALGRHLRRRARLRHRRQRRRPAARPQSVPLVRRDGRQPRGRHRGALRVGRRGGADRPVRLHRWSPRIRLQHARPGRQHPCRLRP